MSSRLSPHLNTVFFFFNVSTGPLEHLVMFAVMQAMKAAPALGGIDIARNMTRLRQIRAFFFCFFFHIFVVHYTTLHYTILEFGFPGFSC